MSAGAHPGSRNIFGSRRPAGSRIERSPLRVGLMQFFRVAGTAIGVLVGFAVSVIVGALVHLNIPLARRMTASTVNRVLAGSFKGRIQVERLGRLGIFGIGGVDATMFDTTGRPVLVLRGAGVGLATLKAARSVVFGKHGPIDVWVGEVSIDDIDVRLDTDPSGKLDLLAALEPSRPSPPDPNARGLRLVVSRISLGHAWAHGQMAAGAPLDVHLDDLRAAVTYAPDLLDADISRARLLARRLANGLDVGGALRAHMTRGSGLEVLPDARLDWQGAVGGSNHSLVASIQGGIIDAVLDVPGVTPEDLHALLPSSAATRPATLHFVGHGPLSNVEVDLRAALGEATFRTNGHVSIGDEKNVYLALEAKGLDAHDFAASVAPSRLGLHGHVAATSKADGALTGDVSLRFLGGSLGANRVPPASIRATLERGPPNRLRGDAEIVVDEPSAPTRLGVVVVPEGSSSLVRFALDSDVPDFDRVPELNHGVRGSARVAVKGSLDIGKMTVDARADVAARGIAAGGVGVQAAAIGARVHGSVADPLAEVTVRASDLATGHGRFKSLDIAASGRVKAPHVSIAARGNDIPDVDAQMDVALDRGVGVSGLRATVARTGERAVVSLDRMSVAGSDLRLDGLRVEGVGSPTTLTMAATSGAMRIRGATEGLDLARIGRLVHLERTWRRGTVSFDADLDLRSSSMRGNARVEVTGAEVSNVNGIGGRIEVKLAGRKVAGRMHAEAAGLGRLDIDAPNVALGGGGALSPAAWRQAFGDVSFDVQADLARLAEVIPPEQFPLTEASGEVKLKGHLVRDDLRDLTPDLNIIVATSGLVITPKVASTREIDGVYVVPPPPFRLAGIDLDFEGSVDGDTGDVKIATQFRDAKGALAHLTAIAKRLPLEDVLRRTGRLSADLRRMPFDVHLAVPERGLGSLPEMLKQNYVSGRLTADLTATGTVLSPKVHLSASVRHSRVTGTSRSLPLELEVVADYDGVDGKTQLRAMAGGQRVLDADTEVHAIIAQLLEGAGSAAWQASAKAHLAGFPLDAITLLDDKLISGQMSGDISIVDLHRAARADVALAVDALRVGAVQYKSATLNAKADGRVIDTSLHIDQGDGFADGKAHASASWGAALAPALDPGQPLTGSLATKNFRVASLLPLVDTWLDELDGRLDAETQVELDPKSKGAKFSGNLSLTGGKLEATAGGGEFHDVTAKMHFTPDGAVTLDKLTASGMTGRLEANGAARLQGTSLQAARGVVVIPSDAPVALSTGGAEIGNIDGRIEISELGSAESGMNLKVDVPHLRVALPQGSSNSAQNLGEIPKLRIGAHRGHPLKFVLVPLDPVHKDDDASSSNAQGAPLTIQTHLGDIEVVRGTDLKIDLEGGVAIKAAKTTEVTGQIQLKPGGSLAVQGKNFRIESGTVTFVGGDPGNPEVLVKAGWLAPDGTTVYANFVGPLKTGKVTLTSEPSLPQQEIVELLMFGTTGGRPPGGSAATSALGTVGGEAAQPLNHALGQLGLGAVSTKVDTTDSAAPKPEVAVQIARDISIQIAVVLGQPPPGVNPDRTLITVDWRFLSKWSLSSTLGDAGTTIFDVLWQNRY